MHNDRITAMLPQTANCQLMSFRQQHHFDGIISIIITATAMAEQKILPTVRIRSVIYWHTFEKLEYRLSKLRYSKQKDIKNFLLIP